MSATSGKWLASDVAGIGVVRIGGTVMIQGRVRNRCARRTEDLALIWVPDDPVVTTSPTPWGAPLKVAVAPFGLAVPSRRNDEELE